MKTFEESIENITKMQDKWLEYYDKDGNLCDKDGNIIDYIPAQMQEAEWHEEESVKINYNPVAESVKRTEPVERYF